MIGINNLRNILMSANSQKNILKKVITFQIHSIKQILVFKKILKNKLHDFDKCFYIEIQKLTIFNISKRI